MISVTAAKACQIIAMILFTLSLVLAVVAAFKAAPSTGKLGLAAGVVLTVSSVFQLLVLGLMGGLAVQCEIDVFRSCWLIRTYRPMTLMQIQQLSELQIRYAALDNRILLPRGTEGAASACPTMGRGTRKNIPTQNIAI